MNYFDFVYVSPGEHYQVILYHKFIYSHTHIYMNVCKIYSYQYTLHVYNENTR